MIYPNAVIPLVAEPIHRGRNDRECYRGHFCCAKARVSRRKSVMPLRLLSNHHALSMFCSSDTACGHNDFCSVRLNGPIWWFILTHKYRLSLSQFTESVLIDSITPGHFCYAKAGVSRRKSVMPLLLLSNHQGLSVLPIFDNSATFVENRSFQTLPRQEVAMNTQSRRHDIYP